MIRVITINKPQDNRLCVFSDMDCFLKRLYCKNTLATMAILKTIYVIGAILNSTTTIANNTHNITVNNP